MENFKYPSESAIIKTEVVCPNDTNPMGILQGGRLVEWMDIAAAVCAQTHAEKICVTASINQVDFNRAAMVGDIITVNAKITRAFNSSMEIFVHAFARKVLDGKNHLISEAYFTFVAMDDIGKASNVIAVKPETFSEKEQFITAVERKKQKILQKKIRVYPAKNHERNN